MSTATDLTQLNNSVELSRVVRSDHALKLPVVNAICTVGTYSHHYAYSAHVKATACMLQSSGVVFVAAHLFPSVEWYHIDSRLHYNCPAISPPGIDRLATLTGML